MNIEDVYTYAKQAYDLIPDDHPHSEEIKQLLIDQVNDELHDYDDTSVPYRRADSTRKGSD
tara:strand:- start:149 stop:331 length:183 start_codon:yes stop_codon:yes gene_type:complete